MLALLVCCSSSYANETVQVCGSYANNVFAASTVPGITATGRCPAPSYNGGGFGIFNSGNTDPWPDRTVADRRPRGARARRRDREPVGLGRCERWGGLRGWLLLGWRWRRDQRPDAEHRRVHVRIPVELLRHAAGVREEQLLCPCAARRPDFRALRPGDERPGLQRAQRPLADDRLDQGNVAVRHIGRLAIRPLLALREP